MSEIVDKMKLEIINRSNTFEEKTKGTKDEYNIYREHIQYVYKYVCELSKDRDVDLEVLELSALLHDIAMTDISLDRSKHNEYSADIAERLLRDNNYSEDKIKLVKKCILNHSSKRKEYRTTKEEQLLVDADCLSHFDSIGNLYSLAHNVMELNEEDTIKFIQDKINRDYNELSEDLKYVVKDKYERVMDEENIKEIWNPVTINLYVDKDPYIKKITDDKIINLTGQTGSGKSKYAQDNFNTDDYLIVDTDEILSEHRYKNSSGINKELGEYFRNKYKELPNCTDDFDLIYTEILDYCSKYSKTIVIDCAQFHCIKDISLLKGTIIVIRTSIDNCYNRAVERFKNNKKDCTEDELNNFKERKKGIYEWYRYTNQFLIKVNKNVKTLDISM